MIILTNDDGIGAPGIVALEQAVAQARLMQPSMEMGAVAVVAPAEPQSGCGHQVTTTAAIKLEQHDAKAWAIAGTPADCTRVALWHLYPKTQWVLSGINAGGNMGSDVYISGTVAAVREQRCTGFQRSRFLTIAKENGNTTGTRQPIGQRSCSST